MSAQQILASLYQAKIEDLISYAKGVDLQSIITNFEPQLKDEYHEYLKIRYDSTDVLGKAMVRYLRTQPGSRKAEKSDGECWAQARFTFEKHLRELNQQWVDKHSIFSLQINLKSRMDAQLSTIMAEYALSKRLPESATKGQRLEYIINVQRKAMAGQICWTRRYAKYWVQKTERAKTVQAISQTQKLG